MSYSLSCSIQQIVIVLTVFTTYRGEVIVFCLAIDVYCYYGLVQSIHIFIRGLTRIKSGRFFAEQSGRAERILYVLLSFVTP